LNCSDNAISPNPQQDGEVETADMEDCIDELNDFHFKKSKFSLHAFEKNYTLHDDDDYFIVHTDWLIRKCDSYNKEDLEKNKDISENICVNDEILIQGLISHQFNCCVIYDQHSHRMNELTFDRIDNNKYHTLEN
jgi:hypothetical protein